MRLRTNLLLLTLATLAPVVAIAILGGSMLAQAERDAFERGARDRSRALMGAVDAQLRGSLAVAEALASSERLEQGDLDGFRQEATRVLARRPEWLNVYVSAPSGQQLMNVLVPPGQPLAQVTSDPASLARAVATKRPVVGDMARGPTTGRLAFAVRAPVVYDGQVRYVVSGVVRPEAISAIIQRQGLPGDWVWGVVDGQFHFVARSKPAGSPEATASPSLREDLTRHSEGWTRGQTVEGTDVYRAFNRSSEGPWAISVAIPAELADARHHRALMLSGAGIAAALVLSLLAASRLSRRITEPMLALTATANALRERQAGQAPPPFAPHIHEVQALGVALQEAAVAVQEREQDQQAAARAKDEFLAMLGHELRNPLAAMRSSAHLLKMSPPPEAAARAQATIERQVTHMARLVDDMLDMHMVTSGKVRLQMGAVDLGSLLTRVMSTLRVSGRLDRHEVQTRLAPAWVHGDEARLEQVATNLLDNAVKYTPAGGKITVETGVLGARAVLTVSDTGQGLSSDMTSRVFELFVQDKRPIDRGAGGLGLGLTLVKRLVEMHGGTVAATSAGPGLGSQFQVVLPEAPPPPPAEAPASGRALREAPLRVLIVEDNADARHALADVLRARGHEVLEATRGADGVAQARALRPQVALVDIGLPDMSGYEVARQLRATQERALHLIALTGYGQEDDRRRSTDAGFDLHLTKPIDPLALCDVLSRLTAEA